MAKIIVAFADSQVTSKVAQGLEAAGIEVFRECATGDDVMRAFSVCDDGVLVCGVQFPDRTADQLVWDLGARTVTLVAGRSEQLELCEHPDVYKLQAPFTMRELTASVNMLLQMYHKRLPHRTSNEKSIIERAKTALMREKGFSEQEAHTYLQRVSMSRGEKMIDCAKRILSEQTGE